MRVADAEGDPLGVEGQLGGAASLAPPRYATDARTNGR
jgi:hypothetical protein